MPFKVNDKKKVNKDNQPKEYMKIEDFSVSNVRVLSETAVSFTLKITGATFYNMRVVETKEGTRFIASPQIKAKNGKYYYQYYLGLDDGTAKEIITAVETALEEDAEEIPFE